ncbi:hypothetical protein PHSY_004729 [Pseudozyma hubeiensis SY62]|uniref:Uncharacterized protein n=1 Tax=Pseudozyma hubeiensis (strain SY62) TaxID=1305764 RepID=R9P724_PSEHS|nr:hypothetical protein PHSY_004729 [Pseudozyma hubeiensis SY62]GAC97144.1 hypothetical protein PHSY_004729 [Pseudozyma hubeiensis SY62]
MRLLNVGIGELSSAAEGDGPVWLGQQQPRPLALFQLAPSLRFGFSSRYGEAFRGGGRMPDSRMQRPPRHRKLRSGNA